MVRRSITSESAASDARAQIACYLSETVPASDVSEASQLRAAAIGTGKETRFARTSRMAPGSRSGANREPDIGLVAPDGQLTAKVDFEERFRRDPRWESEFLEIESASGRPPAWRSSDWE